MIVLLDSSVIFDALNGKRGRAEYLRTLIREGHVLGCCPVNNTEVYAGIRDSEFHKTADFLSSLDLIPIDAATARRAGLLKRDWAKGGHTLAYTDVTIAAAALQNNLPLLTDNRKHFPMQDLVLFPLPPTA
ncbi:MAG: PIN domain-containing protein [Acidobacteria bacterium]|nr:PIN domain-containing protein [Acidobacteriota bacterium]